MKPERTQQTCPLEDECRFVGEEPECSNGSYNDCNYFSQTFDRKVRMYYDKVRRKF